MSAPLSSKLPKVGEREKKRILLDSFYGFNAQQVDVAAHVSLLITTAVRLPLSFYGLSLQAWGPLQCASLLYLLTPPAAAASHSRILGPLIIQAKLSGRCASWLHAAARGGPTPMRLFSCNQAENCIPEDEFYQLRTCLNRKVSGKCNRSATLVLRGLNSEVIVK